jgi:hypothetical protein
MFSYFFINHTKKEIRYAGENDIRTEISYYLLKACDLYDWAIDDRIEMFDAISQPNMKNECRLYTMGGYKCDSILFD